MDSCGHGFGHGRGGRFGCVGGSGHGGRGGGGGGDKPDMATLKYTSSERNEL